GLGRDCCRALFTSRSMAAQIIQVVACLPLHPLHVPLRNRHAHAPQARLGLAQAADEAQLLRVLGGAVFGFEFAQQIFGNGWDGGHGLSPVALAMAARAILRISSWSGSG